MDFIDTSMAQTLQQYGLLGFVVVSVFGFSGWLFKKTMIYFINNIEKKDMQLAQMASEFVAALRANSEVTNGLKETIMEISHATNVTSDALERLITANKDEHAQILHFARMREIN